MLISVANVVVFRLVKRERMEEEVSVKIGNQDQGRREGQGRDTRGGDHRTSEPRCLVLALWPTPLQKHSESLLGGFNLGTCVITYVCTGILVTCGIGVKLCSIYCCCPVTSLWWVEQT